MSGVRRAVAPSCSSAATPGSSTPRKLLPIAYAVGALLLISGVALILADIISPVQLF